MYFYQIGYEWEEGSNYISLMHEQEIEEKEFNEMVVNAAVEILLHRRKEDIWLSSFEEGEEDFYSNFTDIYELIAFFLEENYQFKIVQYKQKVILYGRCRIVEKKDRYKENGEDYSLLDKIRDRYWEKREN